MLGQRQAEAGALHPAGLGSQAVEGREEARELASSRCRLRDREERSFRMSRGDHDARGGAFRRTVFHRRHAVVTDGLQHHVPAENTDDFTDGKTRFRPAQPALNQLPFFSLAALYLRRQREQFLL